MSKLTKKQKKIQELMEGFVQPATAADAIDMLQKVASETSKFDETVECHMRLGIEVKHADQQVRSTTVLPAGLGKTVRVCVIAKADKAALAKEAGADEAGAEEVIEKIQNGWFEFDTLIATPDMMAPLGKLGRILGPKGLMPNPKTGTVTPDVAKAVKEANMAIDINTGTLYRYPIAEISPYPDFMKIAVEYNLPIITSSDAHKPEHCGNHIDDAISYAKSFGYNQSIRFTKRQREFVELG